MDSFGKLARLWLVYRHPRLTYLAPRGPDAPALLRVRPLLCYGLAAAFLYGEYEARQAAKRSRAVPLLQRE